MKNYIDNKNEVFSYEDNVSQEFLNTKISELGLTPISDEDLEILWAPTAAEIEASILSDKWGVYAEYTNTLTVTTAASNKFAADPEALKNVAFKRDALVDTAEILWVESWGSFNTNKVELQEVIAEADKLMQTKIVEIFGTV